MKNKKNNIVVLVAIILGIGIFLLPNVLAESETKTQVSAGNNTLKEAVASASDGDYLELNSGNYGEFITAENKEANTITINKDITICGKDRASTIMHNIFKFEKKADGTMPTVKLCNFGSHMANLGTDQIIFDVESKVDLTMENLYYYYIGRGSTIKVTMIEVQGHEADGSKITLKNTTMSSSYEGIYLKDVNNVTVDVNGDEPSDSNSSIGGLFAFHLENGEGNKITVKNSEISGRSYIQSRDEGISIINQKNLTFDIIDSTVHGVNPPDSGAPEGASEYLFSFDTKTSEKSSNVKINVKGKSKIIDINNRSGSAVFNFGTDNTSDNSNVITIGPEVTFEDGNGSPITILKKYNTNTNYVVVGIKDKDGVTTVKAYEKDKIIPDSDLPVESYSSDSRNYKLTKLESIKDNGGSDITSSFDKTSQVSVNMDIIPTYKKELNIKVKGNETEFHVLEDDKYEKLTSQGDAKSALDALEQDKSKKFSRFVDSKGTTVDANYVFTEDTEISAKYNVEVKFKLKEETIGPYTLEEGQTLADLKSNEKEELENLKTKNGKEFSRLVDDREATFEESTPIDKNMELTIKQKVSVTIGDKEFKIEEGLALSTEKDITDALDNLKVADKKTFKEYYNKDSNMKVENPKDELAVDGLKIGAKYTITVTVNSKEETIDEGKSLEDLVGDAKTELDKLKTPSNKTFKEFVNDKGEKVETNTPLNENTTITANYTVEVKFKLNGVVKGTYTLNENETLENLKPEEKTAVDGFKVEGGKKFSRFVANGETFETTTKITENIEIEIKQFVNVTIGEKSYEIEDGLALSTSNEISKAIDDLKDVSNKKFKEYYKGSNETVSEPKDELAVDGLKIGAKYTVTVTVNGKTSDIDEGKTLKNIEGDAKTELEKLKEPGNKILDKLYANGKEINEDDAIHENVTITAEYNVKVTVKLGEVTKEYTLKEGEKLENLPKDKLEELENFKKSNNRTFRRFTLNDETFNEDTSINENIELTIKQNVKVTIEGEVYELEEGKKLEDSEDILAALEKLANKSNKSFEDYYYKKSNAEVVVSKTSVVNDDIEILAHYQVTVEVDGETATVREGTKLEDIGDLQDKLTELRETTDKKFSRFVDATGKEIKDETELHENTVLTPKYTVEVTFQLNGETKKYELGEGQTLNDLDENSKNELESFKNSNDRTFSRFTLDGETFNENTQINKNTTLIIKQNFKVTIEGKDYYLEEGKRLEESKEILDALKAIRNINTKNFKDFYNLDSSDTIDNPEEFVLNDNLKINAHYTVTVTINDTDYELDEGETLNSIPKEVLDALKAEMDKENFSRLVDKNDETISLDTAIHENTVIKTKFNITVKIGDETFTLEAGKSLSDLEEDAKTKLNSLKKSTTGKKFIGYRDLKTGKIITDKTIINSDIELEILFEAVSVPKTFDNIIAYIIAFIASLGTTVGGIIFLKRKNNQ